MTEFLTEAQRTELAALAAAATPGPWIAVRLDDFDCDDDEAPQPWAVDMPNTEDDSGRLNEPDANFIAAARTAIPALLAEVEQLRAELQGIEDMASGDIVIRYAPSSTTTYTARRNDKESDHD